MQMANLRSDPHLRARAPTAADAGEIHRLLRAGAYSHLHVDWRLPVEWLDAPGAVVVETGASHPRGPGQLKACLVMGADPPPAAWVRIFALEELRQAATLLQEMVDLQLPALRRQGVSEIGWLPREGLPARWVESAGFDLANEVETFVKEGMDLAGDVRPNEAVHVRPVQEGDLPALAEIEAAAFDPLWRHSVAGLLRGWRNARSFHVALLQGNVVGFEYSSDSDRPQTAHLVRLTVHPEVQRQRIGSTLMLAALDAYRRQGVTRVSLNTQVDNLASKRLYRKFGFESAGYRLPVWVRTL